MTARAARCLRTSPLYIEMPDSAGLHTAQFCMTVIRHALWEPTPSGVSHFACTPVCIVQHEIEVKR